MLLFNCEIDFIVTLSVNCVISSHFTVNQAKIFAITHTKVYHPFVTLSTDDNEKLLE